MGSAGTIDVTSAPMLLTGTLRLVPFGPEHITEAYVSWLNDPETVRFSEQRHRRHSIESCAAFISSFVCGPSLLWAIEISSNACHIGNITVTLDLNNRLADIGILIGAQNARGKGYGRQAWGAVVEHLTARSDLRKVTGGCLEFNTAMVKIMRDCGMVEDGYRKDLYLFEGAPSSLLYFSKPGNWKGEGKCCSHD